MSETLQYLRLVLSVLLVPLRCLGHVDLFHDESLVRTCYFSVLSPLDFVHSPVAALTYFLDNLIFLEHLLIKTNVHCLSQELSEVQGSA